MLSNSDTPSLLVFVLNKDGVANVCRPCGLHFFPFKLLLRGGMVPFEMKSRSSLHSTLTDVKLRSDRFMQPALAFTFLRSEGNDRRERESVVTRIESLECHIVLIGFIIIVTVPCLNSKLYTPVFSSSANIRLYSTFQYPVLKIMK